MNFKWTSRPEYPKRCFVILPYTFKLGNKQHEWTHTRERHTVFLETLYWTPNNMENPSDGQVKTSGGRAYQMTHWQWKGLRDRWHNVIFIFSFIAALIIGLIYGGFNN